MKDCPLACKWSAVPGEQEVVLAVSAEFERACGGWQEPPLGVPIDLAKRMPKAQIRFGGLTTKEGVLQMFSPRTVRRRSMARILGVLALVLFVRMLGGARLPAWGGEQTNPWLMSEVMQPADLARELGKGLKPRIVCVGFDSLYRRAHISGAAYHGPTSKPEGLEDLKRWAKDIPRGQRIVLYCGCCPMDRCPNTRPAFQALQEMGFARLQVLSIPQDLERDWVSKGFPVEKAR